MYTGYLYLSLIKTVLVYGYSEGTYREEDDLEPQQGMGSVALAQCVGWHRRNKPSTWLRNAFGTQHTVFLCAKSFT